MPNPLNRRRQQAAAGGMASPAGIADQQTRDRIAELQAEVARLAAEIARVAIEGQAPMQRRDVIVPGSKYSNGRLKLYRQTWHFRGGKLESVSSALLGDDVKIDATGAGGGGGGSTTTIETVIETITGWVS